MHRALLWPWLLLSLSACEMAPTPVVQSPRLVAAGEPFPEVILPGLDREDLPITQLRGKLVVLNIWATWCRPCRHELPSLQRLGEQLDPERFVVLAMSIDDDKHLPREYLIDRKIELASYIDLKMEIANDKLGVQVYPDTYLISPDGRLLLNIEGEREWDSPQVVAALQAAYMGDTAILQRVLLPDVRE